MYINERNFYKDSIKTAFLLVLLLAGLRFSHGFLAIGIVLTGLIASFQNKRGLALAIYLLLPFFVIFNPLIVPLTGVTVKTARFGGVAMILAMMFSASGARGNEKLPLGSIALFFMSAAISSMAGYFPKISYLKMVNCVVFLCGLYFGSRNIHHHPEDVYLLRRVFFAFALIVFFGSLATLATPAIAYSTGLRYALAEGGLEEADYVIRNTTGMKLFTGVVNHSQLLAPLSSCLAGWVLCDMLVVERRLAKLHLLILFVAPVMLYMTRSRAGLLSFAVMVFMVVFYCLPRIHLDRRIGGKLKSVVFFGVVLLMIGAGVAEARTGAMSRWLRKNEDTAADARSLSEAVTQSRQGGIEESMSDFKKNPMFGMGFQVSRDHPALYKMGWITIWSAPLERGFIGTAILGECGICGLICFIIFLLTFWVQCAKRKYFATFSLFVVFLSTNMAEMTFFSPGGGGGIEWLVTVVGGFVIDLAAKNKVKLATEQQLAVMQMLEAESMNPRIGG